jgi:hypothetical protein
LETDEDFVLRSNCWKKKKEGGTKKEGIYTFLTKILFCDQTLGERKSKKVGQKKRGYLYLWCDIGRAGITVARLASDQPTLRVAGGAAAFKPTTAQATGAALTAS